MPDPKPSKRYRATKKEWEDIHAAFKGASCRICEEYPIELHHVLPRSHSGDDVMVNLVPLCRVCHARVEARDPLARAALRESLSEAHIAYLRFRLGERAEAWLDRNYSVNTIRLEEVA
ncbi:MAG: HNH endonuclease [Actinobacteria bacterium]|nr:HNH endonuclease [Actinomycetota bacterium]